ncbi:MAG TPA: DUF4129 domain-containing protein [Pyrinomonadaceae bacterium]|nr:DUF4129 domain-containing protein [Pyrinomonadaceae bacterium]
MSQFSTAHYRYVLAAVLLFLFVFPATVTADPISNYQANLKSAIATLGHLSESGDNFDSELPGAVESVREKLPKHQTVEFEGAVCNVDNSWLHKELDELGSAEHRDERLAHIMLTLQAIETRVAERQNPGTPAENKEWAKTRLESILARPEYATDQEGSSALARAIRDFFQWLAKFLPKPRPVSGGRVEWLTTIAQILVIGLAVAVLLYVLKIVYSRFSGRSRKPKTSKKREARIVLGERLEPEATATDLLSDAEALARQGDLRAAIRKAYIALLVELGDRKLISLAHHKTNRDYLNSLRSAPGLHSRMRGLTDSFERHWYGFASATPNDWQDFRAGYLAALQTETN